MAKITYIQQLTSELNECAESLKSGAISIDEAKALANLAGKTIKSVAVQIEYARIRNETPDIDFMTKPKTAEKK